MDWKTSCVCVAACVFAFLARGRWPYDFYALTRWIVCAGSIIAAIRFGTRKWKFPAFAQLAQILTAATAVVFNPILPLRFRRATWHTLDGVAGMLIALCAIIAIMPKPDSAPWMRAAGNRLLKLLRRNPAVLICLTALIFWVALTCLSWSMWSRIGTQPPVKADNQPAQRIPEPPPGFTLEPPQANP